MTTSHKYISPITFMNLLIFFFSIGPAQAIFILQTIGIRLLTSPDYFSQGSYLIVLDQKWSAMVSMFQTKGEERGMQFEPKLLSGIVYRLSKGIDYVFPVIRASRENKTYCLGTISLYHVVVIQCSFVINW